MPGIPPRRRTLKVLPDGLKIGYHRSMTHPAKLLGAMCLAGCLTALAPRVEADLPGEEVGQVMRLPDTASDH